MSKRERGRRPGIESSTVQLRSLRKREGGEPEAEQRYFEGQSWSESSRSSLFACSTSSTTRPRNTVKNSYYHHNNRNMRLAHRRIERGPSLSQFATCLYSNYLRVHAATDPQLSTAKVHSFHMHYIRQTFRWPLSVSSPLKRQPTSNPPRA